MHLLLDQFYFFQKCHLYIFLPHLRNVKCGSKYGSTALEQQNNPDKDVKNPVICQ